MPSTDGIAAECVQQAAALDPCYATYAGIAGHDHELADLGADGFAGRAELDRSALAALDAAEAPEPRGQVARAAMAERLMGELGYLNDPGAYLGMLDSQQLLAAQVPLDIGVHLELDVPQGAGWREGERWNAEIAWEFLRAHSSWDERQLRATSLPRYAGSGPFLQAWRTDLATGQAGRHGPGGSSLQSQGLSRQGTQPGRHGP